MKILVYGAGVIGSTYAARLHKANYDVTILARNKRYQTVLLEGIVTKDMSSGKTDVTMVPPVNCLLEDDYYDLIIVAVHLDQLPALIPVLEANKSPLIMLMLNYPEYISELQHELPGKDLIFGFPGIGGTIKNNVVEYIRIQQQKTTIGEVNGTISTRIKQIKEVLQTSGFSVAISPDMQSWLLTHALFISCITSAILKQNGNSTKLSQNRPAVVNMVQSIKEGFAALKKLRIKITPMNLNIIFMIMPQWFCVSYWQKTLRGDIGTLAIAPHSNSAKSEIKLITSKISEIVHSAGTSTIALDKLLLHS